MISQDVLIELLKVYLMMTFVLASCKLSELRILEVIVESKKAGARGRNTVNNFVGKTKKSLLLTLVWPVLIYTYLRDATQKRKLKNPKA